ncbi:hypothetical protein, partial [Vibrio paracholerae]
MKIAFLMSGSYRTSLYAVTKEAIRYLREQGHWVDLFFLEKFEQPLIDNDQCIDVSSIHQSTLTRKIFRPVKKILGRHIYEFSISRLVTSKIENYLKDYDCIFIHGTACIALYKLKLPHYVVLHSCKYENFLGRRKGPMKILYQQVYKKIYSDQNLLTV